MLPALAYHPGRVPVLGAVPGDTAGAAGLNAAVGVHRAVAARGGVILLVLYVIRVVRQRNAAVVAIFCASGLWVPQLGQTISSGRSEITLSGVHSNPAAWSA